MQKAAFSAAFVFLWSGSAAGPAGPQGPAGDVLNYADFYALMPPDNAATVAPGTDVSFPQDGPNSGTGIARTGASSFSLAQIGTYQILFEVSVDQAGQLLLALNGADLAYTVVGRATGASQIAGMAIVETSTVDSILTVRNPASNAAALTITPLAGGTRSVSAHLLIVQMQQARKQRNPPSGKDSGRWMMHVKETMLRCLAKAGY